MDQSREFQATCFGLQKSGTTCRIALGESAIEVFDVGGDTNPDQRPKISLDYRELQLSTTGTDDRYISFQADLGGQTYSVLVADRHILDQLEQIGVPRMVRDQLAAVRQRIHTRKTVKWGAWLALGTALVFVALGGWIGFKWATVKVIDAIPVAWEVEIGKRAAADLLSRYAVCNDPELKRAISTVGTRLVGGVGASPYRFEFHVLDGPEINAVALPGGTIFVFRGLIATVDRGDEVAGVLAHEIQHVLRRHGLANVIHQAGLTLIASALFGGGTELQQHLAINAAQLTGMSFSRKQELKADRFGVALMRRAQLDSSALARFLDKLGAHSGAGGSLPAFLSTHPASTDRVAALSRLNAAGSNERVISLNLDWSNVRDRCMPIRINSLDNF